MRLGYHYHIPFMNKNGNFFTPGYQGVFIDSLARNCEHLTCFMHSARDDEESKLDYQLKAKNITFIDLGVHNRLRSRVWSGEKVVQVVKRSKGGLEAFLIRTPTPMLASISKALAPLPISYLVIGDYVKTADTVELPWMKKILVKLWVRWNKKTQNDYLKGSLVLTNNLDFLKEYEKIASKVVKISTSLLSQKDIVESAKEFKRNPTRLLMAGRITAEKGFMDVINALALLLKDGHSIVLDIVGMQDKKDETINQVIEKARDFKIEDKLIFHGYQPYGPQYLKFFKNADIFIMASRTYEGFPRTLWEAMANATPIISTRVGAIEEEVGDAISFVDPSSPDSLSLKIKEIIDDSIMRNKKQEIALELVKKNTLDEQSQKILSEIKGYLQGDKE